MQLNFSLHYSVYSYWYTIATIYVPRKQKKCSRSDERLLIEQRQQQYVAQILMPMSRSFERTAQEHCVIDLIGLAGLSHGFDWLGWIESLI